MYSGKDLGTGGLVINAARGGTELLGISRGAWESIKNVTPAIDDAAGVLKAVTNPFQTAKAGWEATKAGFQSAKTGITNLFEGGGKATAKRTWEITKERLNPASYEIDDAWNLRLRNSNNPHANLTYDNINYKKLFTEEKSYVKFY